MRLYYDHRHFRALFKATDHVSVPAAPCMWPNDLVIALREWAERFYNVRQYSSQRHGGHFPAWEAPDAYAHDIRLFARSLNRSYFSTLCLGAAKKSSAQPHGQLTDLFEHLT